MKMIKENKSLKYKGASLSDASYQVQLLNDTKEDFVPFEQKLSKTGLFPLTSLYPEILQINLGYMCNQTCAHCHVDAGPDRKEIMTKEVLNHCLKALDQCHFHTVDLTGGAPEMNPHFRWFVHELQQRNIKVIVRSNLTILESNKKFKTYPQFFKDNNVTITASLPCYTKANTDKQRGEGVFSASICALKKLNALGYGIKGSGLELNLVFNPGGTSLPGQQADLELDYKRELKLQFGIEFNQLFTITNLPISRFLDYLLAAGKFEEYMQKLIDVYNPEAAKGVMCRNTISVRWDGYMYDCDFNQMLNIKISENKNHIKDFDFKKMINRTIAVNQHCYGCTAGAGSSCQGSIT